MALIFTVLSIVVVAAVAEEGPGGYSYNRFSGPVSGQIQQIQVEAPHGQAAQQHADYGYDHKTGQINPETQKYAHYKTVDYVAKPDYQYAYGVEDPHTGNTQNHKETRDGDTVRGEYSLVEADGTLRVVKYTADSKNGFQAVVHTEPANGAQQQEKSQPTYYGHNSQTKQNDYDQGNNRQNYDNKQNYDNRQNYNGNRNNENRNNYVENRNNYNENRNNNYNGNQNQNQNQNQYQVHSDDGDYY